MDNNQQEGNTGYPTMELDGALKRGAQQGDPNGISRRDEEREAHMHSRHVAQQKHCVAIGFGVRYQANDDVTHEPRQIQAERCKFCECQVRYAATHGIQPLVVQERMQSLHVGKAYSICVNDPA